MTMANVISFYLGGVVMMILSAIGNGANRSTAFWVSLPLWPLVGIVAALKGTFNAKR
jgi:ABC-type polysaccharide/polyol phosphate export permease